MVEIIPLNYKNLECNAPLTINVTEKSDARAVSYLNIEIDMDIDIDMDKLNFNIFLLILITF